MRVEEMITGIGSSNPENDDVDGCGNVPPMIDAPFSTPVTTGATTVKAVMIVDGMAHMMILYDPAP